mgnify:CR=1 FL=1
MLIADEPTTALDVTIQAQILDLMRDLQETLGTAIILITHDMGVVAENADRVVVMYAGRKVEEAAANELFDNPGHPYTKGLLGSIPHLDTAAHSRAHAPQRDQGHGAVAVQPAGGVQLRAALQPGDRPVPRHGAAARSSIARRIGSPAGMPTSCCGVRHERGADAGKAARGHQPQEAFPDPQGRVRRVSGQVYAVDGVSFEIGRGETLGLVGESGCGKSTVGRTLLEARSSRPTARSASAARTSPISAREAMLPYRRRMQMIYQDPYASLNPRMTAGEIVGEPLIIHDVGTPQERRERVAALFERVGLQAGGDAELSARILRRPAPAHRHRPRAGAQSRPDRRRRAGLGARRVDPGADHQPADGPAGRVQALLPVRRPRPRRWSSTSATASR